MTRQHGQQKTVMTVDTTEIHSGGEEFLDDEEFLEELFDTSEESMSVSDDSSDGESTQ